MLKCSKEAFAACPTRHLCGSPEEATFTVGSDCDMFNQQIADRIMTNADCIRAMSDEELAKFLLNFFVEHMDLNEIPHEEVTEADEMELLRQLQQPA